MVNIDDVDKSINVLFHMILQNATHIPMLSALNPNNDTRGRWGIFECNTILTTLIRAPRCFNFLNLLTINIRRKTIAIPAIATRQYFTTLD